MFRKVGSSFLMLLAETSQVQRLHGETSPSLRGNLAREIRQVSLVLNLENVSCFVCLFALF